LANESVLGIALDDGPEKIVGQARFRTPELVEDSP